MSKRIAKLEQDIVKAQEKMAELRDKIKELDLHLQEEKNLEIVNLVKGSGVSLSGLAELLGIPAAKSHRAESVSQGGNLDELERE